MGKKYSNVLLDLLTPVLCAEQGRENRNWVCRGQMPQTWFCLTDLGTYENLL